MCELWGVWIRNGNVNEALLYYFVQCIIYPVNLTAVGGHQVKCVSRLRNGVGDSSATRVDTSLSFASKLLDPRHQ